MNPSRPPIDEALKQIRSQRRPIDEALAEIRAGGAKSSTMDLGSALRTAAQGTSLGFADELEGAVRGVAAALTPGGQGFGEAYRSGRDEARADVNALREASPRIAFALEAVGGLAGGGIGAARSVGASAARTVAGRALAKPLAQGVVTGAVSGAGSAEGGFGERATGAVAGGVLGGLFGGAVQGAAAMRTAKGRAGNKLTTALERDGVDVSAAVAGARKGETLIDVGGENVRKLARAAESIPSTGSNQIRAALVARADEAPKRITDTLQQEAGLGFENAVETITDLAKQRKAAAAPLYEAAFARGVVDDPDLAGLLKSKPSLQAAYRKAQETAAEEGVALAPLDAPDVRTIHLVKEELDDLIRRARRSADQSSPSARNTRAMVQTKQELLERLEAAVPEYGQARAQFAGDIAMEDAFEAAMKGDREMGLQAFLNEDPRRITAAMQKMSPSEQEFYRRGGLDAVRQKIEGSADGRDLTKVIFGNPLMRDRVKALFPDDKAFERFTESMKRERSMVSNEQFVLGGSPTARIQAEQADLMGEASGGFKASDLVHPIKLSEKVIDALASRARTGGEATVDRLAPLLTAQGPDLKKLQQVIEQLKRQEQQRRRLTGGLARAAGVPIGLAAGRDEP